MGQPIVQVFLTQADTSGATKMSTALKGVKSDMSSVADQAEKSAISIDKIGSRNERIASSLVFRNLAQGALGASDAVKGTASAVEGATVGLEIMGRTILAATGEFGLAALGVLAFITIIAKLGSATKETAESIKKQTTELVNQYIETSNAANELKKLGVINEQTFKALEDSASASHAAALKRIQEIANETSLSIEKTRNLENTIKLLKNMKGTTDDLSDAQLKQLKQAENLAAQYGSADKAIAALDEQLKKLTATQSAVNSLLNKKTEDTKDTERLITLNQILIEQAAIKAAKQNQFTELTNAQKTAQEEVNDAQTAYIQALKNGDEASIESSKKRLDAANAMASGVTNALKTVEAQDQKLAAEIQKYSDAIAGAWEWQNDRLIFSTAKASAQIVSIVGKQISTELIMAGTRDLLDPFKPPGLGLAEIAAGASVAALAGGVSAAIAGPGGGASSTSAPSGASSASSPQGSGTNQFTNLRVVIEGGYFDDKAGQNLAKKLSELVQTQNVRLVSSTVQPAFGIKP